MKDLEVLGVKEIEKSASYEERLITFRLNQELIGVNIQDVIKITKDIEITPVPKTKDYILGVMNLRGNIIPVVTLKKKFNLPEKSEEDSKKTIVVVETELGHIGILVDKVEGAININPDEIQPAPMNAIGIDPEFIDGVIMISGEKEKELLTLLNIKKIFKKENL
ncbi:MAG TPA: chemotaxis protein CheW [Persephonella sp.]|uniref:Purine-binding chemotaxis protein CheW n=1 Tax=Persephonella marina (strain DSM 14350 / EX-H1) TaxID=123214 RepID=C0QPD3_PERMH|nr:MULTISPECIES: chemotaxis protein CheW [Persephonella]ACO03989.1 purine-binding chemotaxis protein CheW [Persephonella marina EX-H1]HCB69856.1 chemotaxis protein CheW [Persephonella sp.]